MIKVFPIPEIEEIVAPAKVWDVLESLRVNGLLTRWTLDFNTNTATLEIPKGVEVREMMAGFQELPSVSHKRKGKKSE